MRAGHQELGSLSFFLSASSGPDSQPRDCTMVVSTLGTLIHLAIKRKKREDRSEDQTSDSIHE